MSKFLIDSNSLLFLVRDLLPLDKENLLYDFVKEKFENNELCLLESVYKEIEYLRQGVIIEKLSFLRTIDKQNNLILTTKEHSIVDNNWIVKIQKDKLKDEDYSSQKKDFIEKADCQLVVYAQREKEDIFIITEESGHQNDGKVFKKIPSICKALTPIIHCQFLTEYLEKNNFIINQAS